MKCTDCINYGQCDCTHRLFPAGLSNDPNTIFYNDRAKTDVVETHCISFKKRAGFAATFDAPVQNDDIKICESITSSSISEYHPEFDWAQKHDPQGKLSSTSELKDSGARREFETGAVRDIVEGKGRCDLMPLHEVSIYLDNDQVIEAISRFMSCGEVSYLYAALKCSIDSLFDNKFNQMLEVAKQYEAGAKKYGEHNWEKGIPLHSYIDSAVRHYLKCLRGDDDEPHDRAFVWNILGAIWTLNNKPEMNDIQYSEDMK